MLVFIVRQSPDIDHITPILFKLHDLEDKRSIVVCQNLDYDINSDFRIEFLKNNFNVKAFNFYDIHRFFCKEKAIKLPIAFPYLPPNGRLNGKYQELIYAYFRRKAFIDKFFSLLTPRVIVFDFINSSLFLTDAIVKGANARSIPIVLVPHGTGMRASDVKPMRNLPASDYKLVQSEYYARLYEDNSPARIEILGCARYCDEWEKRYSELVLEKFPTIETGSNRDGLNVLFFERPKIGFFVDHDTVAAALELEFVNVLFKGKPRRKGNRIIPNEDIPSARLVQWADVVVSSISGIVLEALWQKKPVIYLKYLAPADLAIFEQYGACWTVNSQEELFSSLKVLNENPDYRAYPQANVDRLFEEMIYAGDRNRDVLQGYADFFSELLEKTRKQQ